MSIFIFPCAPEKNHCMQAGSVEECLIVAQYLKSLFSGEISIFA